MNVKNHTFSIIIPYYNTKIDQTETCIKSLLVQDLNLLKEIIIVNDGSDEEYTNQLVNLVNELNKEKAIIKLIHQEKLGSAAARKIGFNNSTSEIIMFVDSDDWICDKNCLFKLDNLFKKNEKINLINFKFKSIYSNTSFNRNTHSNETINYNYKIFDLNWYFNEKLRPPGQGWSVWMYAYKKNILQNKKLWNVLDIPHEDSYFISCILSNKIKGLEVNEIFYAYRQLNCKSITSKLLKTSVYEKLIFLSKWFTTFSDWNIYISNECREFWISLFIDYALQSNGFRKLIKFSKTNNISYPELKEIKSFAKKYKFYTKIRKIYMICCINNKLFDYLLPKIYKLWNKLNRSTF